MPPEDPETNAAAIELIPIAVEDREPMFEKVTLQLRKGDYLPTKIDIINSESSSVRFTISNFTINQPLDKKRTHVFTPDLTDVVLNDEAIEVTGEEGAYFPDDERLGLIPKSDEAPSEETVNANE